MPRTPLPAGQARDQYVGLRLRADTLAWIDAEAEREGKNRSAMIRTLVSESMRVRITVQQRRGA